MRDPSWSPGTVIYSKWATYPVDRLVRMIDQDPPACWPVFEALSERDDDATLDVLISQARHTDPERRRAAMISIGRRVTGPIAWEAAEAGTADTNSSVSAAAWTALGRLSARLDRERLIRLLDHPDATMRRIALDAIPRVWTSSDFERLRALARADPENRLAAGKILVRVADDLNWRSLADQWWSSADAAERAWAAALIRRFGDEGDTDRLDRLLTDPDGHVRSAARRARSAIARR